MRKLLVVLPLTLLLSPALRAQEGCLDSETIAECQAKLSQPNNEQKAKEADKAISTSAVNKENQRRLTPADSGGAAGASSMKDFLPILAMFVQSVNLDAKNQQVVIDFNVTSFWTPRMLDVQVQSLIRQPQLFDTAKKQLNATQAQALAAELDDLDDVSGVVTLGVQNKYFGRRLGPNNDVFVSLFDAADDDTNQANIARAKSLGFSCDSLAQHLPHKNPSPPPTPDPQHKEPTFGDYDIGGREELKRVCAEAAIATAEVHSGRVKALKRIHIEKLADLLNNQPQLLFTASHRLKNDLVGPDETKGQLSWEWSSQNLNSFRKKTSGVKDAQTLIKNFEDLTHDAQAVARYKLFVQYTHVAKYTLARPGDNLDLHQPSADRWVGSFTFGKSLLFDGNGKETGRIDAAINFENFSDDPDHKDRWVANATYTQKLSDTFSFPIGIIYANHERFLGDVQSKFGAHFGLKMKLPFGNN